MILVLVTIGVFLFGPPTIWIWQIIALSFAIACLMAVFRFDQQKIRLQYESKLLIQLLAEDMLTRTAAEADEGIKKRLFGGVCEVMVHNPLTYSDFLTMLERKVQKNIIMYGTAGSAEVWQEILDKEIVMGASYENPTPPFHAAQNALGALKLINRACAPRP